MQGNQNTMVGGKHPDQERKVLKFCGNINKAIVYKIKIFYGSVLEML